MTVRIAPPPLQQFFVSGLVASGYKLFTYAAGTTTKLATYTDSTGGTPNSNPIVLDANGGCNLWLTQGSAYKLVLAPPTDTDPPTNAVWTRDIIYGVNDSYSVLSVASALGTADALVAAFSPAITTLSNNTLVYVKASYANATTTPTFTPNNGVILPATIVKGNNLPLAAGDIQPSYWMELIYNSSIGKWCLINPATGIAAALARPTIAKSAPYTLTATDSGKLFLYSGTNALTLFASSVAGNGFSFGVHNTGAGVITISPVGGDLINGAASVSVDPGQRAEVSADGVSSWVAEIALSSYESSFLKSITSSAAEVNYLHGSSVDGYRIEVGSYANKSFIASSQDSAPQSLWFSADGTSMYIYGGTTKNVYQYSLSVAWDVSTASYSGKSISASPVISTIYSFAFSADGTKMYCGDNNTHNLYQFALLTPWDVSTAAYASKSFFIAAQDSTPTGITFSADGTKMYLVGLQNKTAYQYTLSTPWDISTATYANKSSSVSSFSWPYGITFKQDGLRMYISGTSTVDYGWIYQYNLSTAWDVSTAMIANKSFFVKPQDQYPVTISFNPTGTRMFFLGASTYKVYQYYSGMIVPA